MYETFRHKLGLMGRGKTEPELSTNNADA